MCAKQSTEITTEEALIRVFRTQGYEGTSLSALSEATGLIKASLYHRFPGGKEEMAAAALESAEVNFQNYILSPFETNRPKKQQLGEVCRRLKGFYEDGKASCLLDTLSLRGTPQSVLERSKQTAQLWAKALVKFASSAGLSNIEAKIAAERALIEIEGSLVLCRLTGTAAPFERALGRLPGLLLGKCDAA